MVFIACLRVAVANLYFYAKLNFLLKYRKNRKIKKYLLSRKVGVIIA